MMRKLMMTGGASLAGLCFALFGVAWLEFRSRRIDHIDEVVHGLGMKLIGTVPRIGPSVRASAGKANGDEGEAQQVLTDSVDATRTLLLHLARSQSLRTVMVSSALAGEGKTSLSCRLAVSLARAGLRTLLIDGDTRNPSVHKVFGGACEPGFCESVCGKTDARTNLRETPVPNLRFLPAGRWSDQLPVMLDKGEAGVLFNQFSQDFDIILVDSPPILPVADALQIGQQVDGVLLSVLCHVSRLNTLYAASQLLEELNIRTMGVVINGVQGRLYGAKYPYSYAYRARAKA
jgi:capsular exopolysaccharide synthesis family protein